MNDEKERAFTLLHEIVGQEGCFGACTGDELYQEDGEWKLFLCGFMEPWPMGKNLAEVKTRLQAYAGSGFGPAG